MPPTPSLARDFFDKLVGDSNPAAAIRGLVTSPPSTFETDWLDFKGENPKATAKERDESLKRCWSESLGGFANNQGGVLVLGIDARKTPYLNGQVDAASNVASITNPLAVKSRLIELQRQATDPPLGNVLIEAYEDAPGSGFVVCFVPEGTFKPYRAEHADRNYYLRAGDSTAVMSRSVLQSMFYPRTRAVFEMQALLHWRIPSEDRLEAQIMLDIRLRNKGTGTARDAMMHFCEHNLSVDANHIHPGSGWVPDNDRFRRVIPMHPQEPFSSVASFRWPTGAYYSSGENSELVPHVPDPLTFKVDLYADNQDVQKLVVQFCQIGHDKNHIRTATADQ